ncbi:MAG: GEVED domain-containing protein [Planctomycetota bacterium]
MATFGFGSGSSSGNRNRTDRSKARKIKQLRRSMLETLEVRNLMTTGLELIGIQPNEGSVLALGATSTPTVLNVSPRELVLRFGDGAQIDPTTLGGIQIKRAGSDGSLGSAYLTTDLGTNAAAVLDFSASLPGQQGNGTEIRFTQSSRTIGVGGKPASYPIITVQDRRITIEVNVASGFKTTAGDLVRAMREDAAASRVVVTSLLRGSEFAVVADTVPLNTSLFLIGADSARASTNFNSGNAGLQAEFVSVNSASQAAGVRVEFTSRSFDVPGPPNVLVDGQTIRVELNSNPRALTTVQEVLDAVNGSRDARALVVARLVSGSALTRIGGNPTNYSPLILSGGDDVLVTPAYIGLGDTGREVIVRFGETLPDDSYVVDIIGNGAFALRDVQGVPFNGGVSRSVRFDLDLGPTVQAVVPQPVVTSGGTRQQLRNVIYVYFNGDKLKATEAVNPVYYQLIHTGEGGTVFGGDDVVIRPLSVNYDASINRVALSFDRNIDELVNPSNPGAGVLPLTALRLRIGNDEGAVNTSVTPFNLPSTTDAGDQFNTAFDLGGGWLAGPGARAAVVSSEIRNRTPYVLDFPGANNEASNRNSRYQQHVTRVDNEGIDVVYYNFASTLGTANASVQLNAITEVQKVMVRQVISLYERYLGARFVESDNQGFTIAVGDMQAIDPATALTPLEANRPGGLTYAAGPLLSNASQSAVIIDSQDFNTASDNLFGTELFRSFMRGVGVLLGLGNADELPQSTIQNNSPITDPNVENVFPGNADIIHGQHLFRPESRDIDLYRFTLPSQGGRLTAQVAAERQVDSSLLDAALRLYRNEGTSSAPRWVELAANDDYFSKDPRIDLEFVGGGEYAIGVSAKGNNSYDPTIADSGLGGRSEGKYQLRIDFRPPAASTLVDANGSPTPLDGDGDGRPGGVFNYWFVPTRPDSSPFVTTALTLWVDKTAAAGGTGTLALPYNTISAALNQANTLASLPANSKRVIAVRILGNSQNQAYEIGFNRFGQAMADGSTFDVPQNVNVMIDAGAIIKMGRSRISVGSSTVSVNRSGGSLQLLGTPDTKVILTSLNDTVGIGVNPDRNPPAASAGDWGGIDFRNRIDGSDETRKDRERDGLFLNAVVHSDIRFGGGQVLVDGVSQVITPIHIIDSRPTIANNSVTRSADAAISATPNSFREDDFRDPRSQGNGAFIPDYERIGPDIRGNRVINNTINGLFVKTRTGAADTLETVTVAARFNEVDIPYVIGENLVVAGTPGGGILDIASPPSAIVVLTRVAGGSLAAGTYNYRIVYVDANGNESLASVPTNSLTVVDGSSIELTNLPPISSTLPYVGRRVYRSTSTGSGPYRLVENLNATKTSFVDNGTAAGAVLADLPIKIRPRLDGSLMIDPGSVIKNQGSRIEVLNGGVLMAEGTTSRPIIMTSVNDIRYGAGGTFDTAGNKGLTPAVRGDWGGIFIGHGSSASIDQARISFGGGTNRIEGGFASFNPIEVHQGDLRLANSTVEQNASGANAIGANRNGRGTNAAAAIFVRGAQPVLVGNRISANSGAAINIDVNSMTQEFVNDPGRTTGPLGTTIDTLENQGPLVRGNAISKNSLNGMLVRGQTLTSQSVWDDADIVHIVQSQVTSDNHHTYGGLQLKSAPNQSLVVKFGGTNALAGLTATGTPLDIQSRIGGSIQLLGQPGYPVILTALPDDSVGAGFGIDGRPNTDTDNNGALGDNVGADIVLPTGPEVDRGTLIDNDVDVNRPGFFSARILSGGGVNLASDGGITAQGVFSKLVNENVIFQFTNYIDLGSNGGAFSLASTTITRAPTLIGPDLVVSEGTFVGNNNQTVSWRVESKFRNGVAKLFNTLTLTSSGALGNIRFINYLDEDIRSVSDDFLYITGTPGKNDFRLYTIDNSERVGFSQAGFFEPGPELVNASYIGFAADRFRNLANTIEGAGTTYTLNGNINLANLPPRNDPNLGLIYGLADVTTALAWQISPSATTSTITTFLELIPQNIDELVPVGSWQGVSLQTYSNDRNIGVANERELPRSTSASINDTPSTAQYLGQLARSTTSGDENTRLGFQVQGVIGKPSDVDVYSFTAFGGTEVWLDIDRTDASLDTVVELISADGAIVALSDNSYLEEVDRAANPLYSTLGDNSVNPLRKSPLGTVPQSSRGDARDDYSTNVKDAGFRVKLPGLASQATLYHVRVRSSNQYPGQPAGTPALTNPASVGQGLSRGAYQLQVRLGEAQEFPGSYVGYADIRYATTGLNLNGVPRHSPLVGENGEISGDLATAPNNTTGPNNTFLTAQELGNLLQTDRKAISVAGNLSSLNDIDWFTFTIDYPNLVTPLREYLSTIFDIDYADGIGRADMSMYLFSSNGTLVRMGENSNLLDDRHASISAANNSDLGRGSTGTLDPFIGPTEIPAGRYYLALTNRTQVPSVLANRLNTAVGNANVRILPVSSTRLLVEDRVGDPRSTTVPPVYSEFLNLSSRVEYALGDVPLYFSQSSSLLRQTSLYLGNGFTGEVGNDVGTAAFEMRDTFIRPNGDIRGFAVDDNPNVEPKRYILIDPGTGVGVANGAGFTFGMRALTAAGELTTSTTPMRIESSTVMPLAGAEFGFLVANRGQDPADATGNIGVRSFRNIVYRFDPSTGQGLSAPSRDQAHNIAIANAPDVILGAGTDITERGFIDTNSQQGVLSTRLAFTEATRSVGGSTQSLINDGDRFTLTANVGGSTITRIFEFNSGPELFLNFAPNATPARVLSQGDQFQIDGVTYQIETGSTPVATPGVRTVFYKPSMDNAQFARAVRDAVPASIQVGFDGNRLNFSGAMNGSFDTLVLTRGVATQTSATGGITGQVPINFLAHDTAETIAARVVEAIRGQSLSGVDAVQRGTGGVGGRRNEIELRGPASFSAATGEIQRMGVLAPNGTISGVAGVNDDLYAVSNVGGLYRVGASQLFGTSPDAIGSFVETSYELRGISFTGLVRGPINAAGGAYRNVLFGLTATGRIYAFDTNGYLQPVFANGANFIDTGIFGLDGLAFSNLDFNLWHTTSRRETNPGHGVNADLDAETPVQGGRSWYFGFDGQTAHSNASLGGALNPLASPRALGTPLLNSYNFPGGALGVLESKPISLAGISAADVPTLYFNYFLSSDQGASATTGTTLTQAMTDSFRVYAVGDDGNWVQLATNNDSETAIERLADNVTGSIPNGTVPAETVTNPSIAWRQARVSLAGLAGNREVRLRFEFSTAGGLGYDSFGGRGPELRTIAGSGLRDGQVFTVNGRTFEIEMGTSMVFPSGAGIRNGETFSVAGANFVFWNGTGTAPAGNVIRFSSADSPAEIASATRAAINAATLPSQLINLTLSPEPSNRNEIINTATPVNNVAGVRTRVEADGAIGDIVAGPGEDAETFRRDVDMLRVNAEAGTTLNIRVSAKPLSQLNPRIRLFDAFGNEIARTTQNLGSSVALIATVSRAGEYFVGISNTDITNYNPILESGRSSVGLTGQYGLTMDIAPNTSITVIDNRLQLVGLSPVVLSADSRIQSQGAPGVSNSSNVPVQILQTMTSSEVAVAVSRAIEQSLSNTVDQYPTIAVRDDFLDMTGYTVQSAGPFSVSGARPGDEFSEYGLPRTSLTPRRPALRARNNAFEGLFLDDFMIGLAERGESVTGATADTTFVRVPSEGSEILVGSYQLEIRSGSEYGSPTRTGINLNRAFEPNQGLNNPVEIRFNGSSQISDGSTITINDGTNFITLEFDDISLPAGSPGRGVQPGNLAIPFDSIANESAFVIAERFRNTVNSSVVQSVLNVGALSSDGSSTGRNSTDVTLVGSVTVNMNPDIGFIFNRSPNVRFNSSSSILDGDLIRIEDGMNSIALEFDSVTSPGVQAGNVPIPFNPALNESGVALAARVLAIINSPVVQSRVRVAAFPVAGLGGQASDAITIGGSISVSVNSRVGAVVAQLLEGDRNVSRDQGQVLIENSRISNSSDFGIALNADARDSVSQAPNPGTVRNLLTINDQRLIPGAVVINNELIANRAGGIRISGEPATASNLPAAPVPFARVVNNTILGGRVSTVTVPPSTTVAGTFYKTGSISFADSVVSYDPRFGGGPIPLTGLQDPVQATGAPNFTSVGEPRPNQGVVSLGRGGRLVVRFDDNILTGSNDASPDLAVYEVGNAELVRVEVSADGVNYTSVGSASFNSPFIDLDQYGFNSLSQLYFVRLTDEPNEGGISGDSVGADIDAVGAISSRPGFRFTPGGTGVRVQNSASPTLLNNIVVNSVEGINVSGNSSSTVIGGTLYQANTTNTVGTTEGQFPIVAGANVPLFTNVGTQNLYPLPGAPSIDASIDSLLDRSAMLTVKQPLGLAPSPIIAPALDIYGALRVDDPTVTAPPGLGESIFKERGAADRSDFLGPVAVSINPLDNDAAGLDGNPATGTIELVSSSLQTIDIQLIDASALNNVSQGSDIDPTTVLSAALTVTKNSQVLLEGRDYRFGYDATSKVIRLTSLSGLWESGAVYSIRFVIGQEQIIEASAPSQMVDGTVYTILDANKAPRYFEIDTGLRLNIPTSLDGLTHSIPDGALFRIDDGARRVLFEFDNNNTSTTGVRAIPFSTQDPPSVLASKMADAIRSEGLNLTVQSFGNNSLQIFSQAPVQFIPENSGIASVGQTGTTPVYGVQIQAAAGVPQGIVDGQTFTVQRGGLSATFEFDGNGTTLPENIRVGLNTASASGQATLIANAINGSGLGISATVGSNGYVSLGTDPSIRIASGSTGLTVVGVPGRNAATPITINLATTTSAVQVAQLIESVLDAANMPGVDPQLFGTSIRLKGATGASGLGVVAVQGIRDRAGNPIRANELNGESVINIFVGEGFDYGDAPDPIYSTLKNSNGPRHKVVRGFSMGPTVTADPDARLIDADVDDGVTFSSLVRGFSGSMQLTLEGISISRPGFAAAWIDFDGDGIFESTEKINITGRLVNGVNTPIPVFIPGSAVVGRPVAARVRFGSNEAAISVPTGDAPDGEVEDYLITIGQNPYTNPLNKYDVNGDTFVSPIDVLQIVNYINSGLPSRPPMPPVAVPPYLDVDSDGFISALDVLNVIDFINANLPGGSGGGEGEGEGARDVGNLWIAAPPAPVSQANQRTAQEQAGSIAPPQAKRNSDMSLDMFLASLASQEMGPLQADESIDAISSATAEIQRDDADSDWAIALDDVLRNL